MEKKYRKIFGDEWYEALEPFLKSKEFKNISKHLKQLHDDGNRIFPLFDEVFRPFKECPLSEVITVFLTTNPYTNGEGDGLAFSARKALFHSDMPPVLNKIFDGVEKDLDALYLTRICDLTRWANQGVLLLNIDLTCEKDKPGSHIKLWQPFIEYVLKVLQERTHSVIYVLIGKPAQKYADLINPLNNDLYPLEHPMIAIQKNHAWKHKNIFSTINRISNFINNKTIQWIETVEW